MVFDPLVGHIINPSFALIKANTQHTHRQAEEEDHVKLASTLSEQWSHFKDILAKYEWCVLRIDTEEKGGRHELEGDEGAAWTAIEKDVTRINDWYTTQRRNYFQQQQEQQPPAAAAPSKPFAAASATNSSSSNNTYRPPPPLINSRLLPGSIQEGQEVTSTPPLASAPGAPGSGVPGAGAPGSGWSGSNAPPYAFKAVNPKEAQLQVAAARAAAAATNGGGSREEGGSQDGRPGPIGPGAIGAGHHPEGGSHGEGMKYNGGRRLQTNQHKVCHEKHTFFFLNYPTHRRVQAKEREGSTKAGRHSTASLHHTASTLP